jgi:hypothetical protein
VNSQQLSEELRQADTPEMRRRRAIIGLSLVGMASMAAVSLLQTGIVEHLPDPPIDGFNSDQTNLSDVAYQFDVPDGTLALASFVLTVPLVATGGRDRHPWLALATAGKAVVDAVGAGEYFWQMLSGKQEWCSYCITGAAASFGILVLALPDA